MAVGHSWRIPHGSGTPIRSNLWWRNIPCSPVDDCGPYMSNSLAVDYLCDNVIPKVGLWQQDVPEVCLQPQKSLWHNLWQDKVRLN